MMNRINIDKWKILAGKLKFPKLFASVNREKIEEIIVVLSISIMSLLLRIPYITSYDPNNDGYYYLNNAKDLYNLKCPSRYFISPGFSFLSIPFLPLFGDQACNAASLFFSILSIPMIYKLTAKYYNTHAGYVSALLFGTTPLHIFWSGRDYSDVTSLFWIMLTLYYHFSNDYNKSALVFAFAIFVRLPNVMLFPLLLFSSNNLRAYLKYLPLFFAASLLDLVSRFTYYPGLQVVHKPRYQGFIFTEEYLWRNLGWCKDGFIGWSVPHWGMWENYFITAFFLLALFLMPKKEEIKIAFLWFTPFFLVHLFWFHFAFRFFFPVLPLFCMIGSKPFKVLLKFPKAQKN